MSVVKRELCLLSFFRVLEKLLNKTKTWIANILRAKPKYAHTRSRLAPLQCSTGVHQRMNEALIPVGIRE